MNKAGAALHYLADEAWHRRVLAVLTTCVAIVYAVGTFWTVGTRGSLVKGDARAYFAYLPSLVVDRDLDLRNQFAILQPEGTTALPFGEARGGGASNPFPVTPALLWLPGYLAGLVIDSSTMRGAGAAPLGYGAMAVLGAAVWSIVLTGAAADLTRRLVKECVGPEAALAATVLAWLATSAIYYTAISPLYSHGVGWFAVSLMLWLTWQATQATARTRDVVWAGVAAGMTVGVRLQDATLLLVPVAMLVARYGSSFAIAVRAAAVWSVGVAVGLLPQILTWLRLEGATLPLDGAGGLQAPSLVNAAGVLFSGGYRGWISWTPIVAPALVGLGLAARRAASPRARRVALFGLFGIGAMYLLDVVHPFGAGAAFGGRRYVSATPLVALGLGACLSPLAGDRVRRVRVAGLFAVLLLWNGWLLTSYELLTLRHGLRPTLLETARYGVGLGRP